MYFAPRERLTSSKLQNCYEKYQAWYKHLPAALWLEGGDQPQPHVLVLQYIYTHLQAGIRLTCGYSMLYHTMIVHLFRPMLKVNLIHSDVRPRDICIDAANTVSRIVRIYRSLYDFRVAHLTIPHILLNICIVHLLYSKDNHVSRQNLVEGLKGLEDLHECHYFGARSFRIIHSLSQHWNLPFPKEHQHSKMILRRTLDPHSANSSPADPLLVAPNTLPATVYDHGTSMSYSRHTQHHPDRRESLSMFGKSHPQLAPHSIPSRPSSVVSTQHLQSSAVGHTPMQSYSTTIPLTSFPYSQPMSTVTANTVSTSASSPINSSAADALFWTPIPGIPGPILPRNSYQQHSAMGIESMLQSSDMGERLGRDGFKINEDWRSSHVNGFHTGGGDGVFSTTNTDQPTGYATNRSGYTQSGENVAYVQSGQHEQQDYVPEWWHNPHSDPGPMS